MARLIFLSILRNNKKKRHARVLMIIKQDVTRNVFSGIGTISCYWKIIIHSTVASY